MFRAIIFDTETTCLDDPEIIEAAYVPVFDVKSLTMGDEFLQRYRPQGTISLGAMATHHILPGDLTDCQPSREFHFPTGVRYLIGHNVDFDWRAAGSPEGIKRICTLALCRSLYPEADSHSLGAMMYLLFGEKARVYVKGAHSAMADVLMCRMILEHILDKRLNCSSFEELWEASEGARIPKVMSFGKHKGSPIGEIPADYRRWLMGQPDLDPYLRTALNRAGEVRA